MNTFIQTHGARQLGPLIQYTGVEINEENEIELEGCNYTIYVDRNEENETMIADVFIPIKE